MKIYKRRNLFGLIYALIMLLPLSSVLFRCAYTIFNKNAYLSYDGFQKETDSVLATRLESGLDYKSTTNNYSGQIATQSLVNVDNLDITTTYANLQNLFNARKDDIKYIAYSYQNSNSFIYLYDENMARIEFYNLGAIGTTIIYFTALNNVGLNNNDVIYNVVENSVGNSLDNAFEYSLHEFVGNNGRGVLNLTDWFTDVFLQRSNHTMLYLDFVNWYMNYTLLVSCVYLLYLVLMWFISLARRILTKYEEV